MFILLLFANAGVISRDIIPFIPAILLKKQSGTNRGRMLFLVQLGIDSKQCYEPYLGNEEKLRGA
jgi:hypothetical protein